MSKKHDPEPKRIKLLELGGGKHVTQSGKVAILRDLKALGVLSEGQAVSRRTLLRERAKAASRTTPFGPCIVQKTFNTSSGPKDYPVQNPLAMLHIAMLESDRYSNYVRDAIRLRGKPTAAAPWTICIYVDEVTCGNPLAVRADARRKVEGVYWALYSLGPMALSDESAWFELVAFRTSETVTFEGSVSHLLDVCLTAFFDPEGYDLKYGLSFTVKGYGDLMLLALVEMLIADIKAIVEAIGANGVSAILPCFLCRYVLSFKAKAKDELKDISQLVDLGCLDQQLWGKHTDASLLRLLNELEVAKSTLPPEDLKKKITLSGYKPLQGNFLLNANTIQKPIKVIQCDWMHLFFQTGNWNREVFRILFLATTRTYDAYAAMAAYVGKFSFPHGCGFKGGNNLLGDAHWESCKKAEVFKTTASDGLTLYAILCKFFEDVLLQRYEGTARFAPLRAKVTSYSHMCDVIDLVQLSKHGRQVAPDLLDEKIETWIQSHVAAYGTSLFYLKTHLTRHLPDQLRARLENNPDDAMLLACWTLDRDRNNRNNDVCVCTNRCTTPLA
jgi:hypothetical protein